MDIATLTNLLLQAQIAQEVSFFKVFAMVEREVWRYSHISRVKL